MHRYPVKINWFAKFKSGWWFEPLWKNINQLGWLFPIYGKIKNVPNHQPEMVSATESGDTFLQKSTGAAFLQFVKPLRVAISTAVDVTQLISPYELLSQVITIHTIPYACHIIISRTSLSCVCFRIGLTWLTSKNSLAPICQSAAEQIPKTHSLLSTSSCIQLS